MEIEFSKKHQKSLMKCSNYVQKDETGPKESELQTILMQYAMEQGMFDTGYKSTLNPLIIAGGPNGRTSSCSGNENSKKAILS